MMHDTNRRINEAAALSFIDMVVELRENDYKD